jgi:hypothetical protein
MKKTINLNFYSVSSSSCVHNSKGSVEINPDFARVAVSVELSDPGVRT